MMSTVSGRRARRNRAETGADKSRRSTFWWWPAIIAPFSVLGLIMLNWYQDSLFLNMTPSDASIYMMALATALLILCLGSIALTFYEYRSHRPNGQ